MRFCCLILIAALATFPAAAKPFKDHTPKAEQAPVAEQPSGDTAMQSALGAVMSGLGSGQLEQFAACLEKYVDPQTAQNVAGQSISGGTVQQGGYDKAQQFLATPQGQQVMQKCQTEIQALLPTVQNQLQKDSSPSVR